MRSKGVEKWIHELTTGRLREPLAYVAKVQVNSSERGFWFWQDSSFGSRFGQFPDLPTDASFHCFIHISLNCKV